MRWPLPSSVGRYTTITGGSQTLGGEVADTVPTNTWWGMLSVKLALTKGGAGGTPTPVLQFADASGNVFWEGAGATTGQVLSTVTTYTWAPGQPTSSQIASVGTVVHATASLPDGMVLGPGFKIQTLTLNTVGGTSSYGTPVYYVCQLGGV